MRFRVDVVWRVEGEIDAHTRAFIATDVRRYEAYWVFVGVDGAQLAVKVDLLVSVLIQRVN